MYFLSFLLLLVINTGSITEPSEQALLKEGMDKKISGQFAEALEAWEQGRIVLKEPSLAIALEHIQLATEAEIKSSYQISSAMYMWGLADENANKELIEQEMNMLEPLVTPAVFKKWKKAFKKKPKNVLPLIYQFWLSEDQTPETPYNERLMEHWERVGYAKSNFKKNDDSVYGTDARGVSWVQYGKPRLVFSGELTLEPTQISTTVLRRLGMNGGNGNTQQGYARAMENAILQAVKPAQEYEIWLYTDHDIESPFTSNHVLMFGETPSKTFTRVQTINDFIPSELFTFSQRFAVQTATGSIDFGIMPAVIVQHEYLKQLAGIDPLFGRAYANLLTDFFRADEPPRKEQGLRYRRDQVTAAKSVENAAPEEASTYITEFPAIGVTTYPYRFLDDENKPFSIVYMESTPLLSFITDVKYNEDSVFVESEIPEDPLSYYSYTHTIQIRNSDWQLLSTEKLFAQINVDIEQPNPKTTTIFTIPHVSDDTWLVYSAQLKNNHPKSKPSVESLFPEKVRGLGSHKELQSEPLNTKKNKLEMSDIVFGYDLEENSDSVFLPFTVSHTREIPRNKQMAFHYEVYHLKKDRNNIRKLQLELEIKEKRSFIERLTGNPARYTLTLNQDTDQSIFRENLELVTADLEIGSYVLSLKITDTNSKKTIEKDIEFEIVEE